MAINKILFARKEDGNIYAPVYSGLAIEQMSKLEKDEVLLSIAGHMDLRNIAFQSGDKDWINQVCYNYFDSGDGIVYDKKGNVKIDLDSNNLKNLTPRSKLENFVGLSALNLEQEEGAKRFDDLPDEDPEIGVQLLFTPKEVREYTSKHLTEQQAPKNKFWLALARGDEERLGTYVQNVYHRINNYPELMKIKIPSSTSSFEAERIWRLSGSGCNSDNGDGGHLNSTTGRLVMVAPKMQVCDELAPNFNMIMNLLTHDLNILRDSGDLSPKIEKVLNQYDI